MTKLIAVLLLSLGALCAQEGKVMVDEKDLTPDQLAKVKAQQTMTATSEYVKWGHEVGIAMNETFAALTDNAAKFAKTDVGKWTMFLVSWKIMAKDILSVGNKVIGYLIGIPFLVIGLLICLRSYWHVCVPRRVLIEKGTGFWIWRSKKYEMYDPGDQKGNLTQDEWVGIHALAAFGIICIASIMIFA